MVEFDDFRVLFTPRTGSRALEEFLLGQGGACVGAHHTQRDKVPRDYKPNYTVAREPSAQLESWYHSVYKHTPYKFMEFVHIYGKMDKFKPMNPYIGLVDHVFIYENSLEFMLTELGFTVNSPLPIIGKSVAESYKWAEEELELVEKYFPEDCEFYTVSTTADYLARMTQPR